MNLVCYCSDGMDNIITLTLESKFHYVRCRTIVLACILDAIKGGCESLSISQCLFVDIFIRIYGKVYFYITSATVLPKNAGNFIYIYGYFRFSLAVILGETKIVHLCERYDKNKENKVAALAHTHEK